MIEHVPLIVNMLKIIGKVTPWLIRWHYTEEKLKPFVKFSVSSSGQPISYVYQNQESMCYVSATNLSPFDFIIDRLLVSVVMNDGGAYFTALNVMPQILKATSTKDLFARSHSPMLQNVALIRHAHGQAMVSIVGKKSIGCNAFLMPIYWHEDIDNTKR